MDRPQWKKCFDCGHRGHCRLYKVVLQNFCAVDLSTQWGRNICFESFYYWWSITKCVWSSREKWKGHICIDLVYGLKWIVLQNRRKYGERKTQKILCYKYLKFCQCASGGFVLRCRQCKEAEICGRKMKLIGQNLHWIPDWLWLPPASGLGNQTIISDYPKTYSKLRIYWYNYWEIIWKDPNKQRGHRRDN